MKNVFLLAFALFFSSLIFSQEIIWNENENFKSSELIINPSSFNFYEINFENFRNKLSNIKSEGIRIDLPMPDGKFLTFDVITSQVMHPDLAVKFPEIKTFNAKCISKSGISAKLDITAKGFHAIIFAPGFTIYIDPAYKNSTTHYICYSKKAFYKNVKDKRMSCAVDELKSFDKQLGSKEVQSIDLPKMMMALPSGTELRTYRLAVACTGEYTAFHGGTVINAMSAIVTSINRVSGIYEREVSVRLQLIANNDQLIYTDAATDPYTNSNGGSMLSENQTTVDNTIGLANYDIGHVFSTGGGGVAYLQSVCSASSRAGGVTGQSSPVNDPFDVDYVCHEMGHQFGGNHTQNNACNRSTNAAYEPGSASTIMGYAGICAPNIQSNSDDHFHTHSYEEIVTFSTQGNGNTCAAITNTNNSVPVVSVPTGGFSIPISTPFTLSGSAIDSDNDTLFYRWEQHDLGPVTSPGDADLTSPSGNAPTFRSFSAVDNGNRTFPQLTDIINNTHTVGELLPTYSRDLSFRLTALDYEENGGGVDYEEVEFFATDQAGPFLVSLPNGAESIAANAASVVSWDVANTNLAPVNCQNVNILLSIDGGYTYPYSLISNTPNDGSELVNFPDINSTLARIKIEAADNIFFDISNSNFIIDQNIQPVLLDLSISNVTLPIGNDCDTVFEANFTFTNTGVDPISSFSYLIVLNGDSIASFTLSSNLLSGENVNQHVTNFYGSTGINDFTIYITGVNGIIDDNILNNSVNNQFTLSYAAFIVDLIIDTDCYGTETGVSFNPIGQSSIFNAPTGTLASSTQIVESFCLNEGCYEVVITDSYGDGMNGSQWNGCDINGNVSIVDDNGLTLIQLDNPQFGNATTLTFCLTTDTVFGCTNSDALNYNLLANTDDGSCIFPEVITSINYELNYFCDSVYINFLGSASGNEIIDWNWTFLADTTINSSSQNSNLSSYQGETIEISLVASSAYNTDTSNLIIEIPFIQMEELELLILTDSYPSETSWDIQDTLGNVIHAGGSFSIAENLYTLDLCLAQGCYIFTMYDSYGDGMQNLGIEGSYLLISNGDTLVQNATDLNFGLSVNHNFCIETPCIGDFNNNMQVDVSDLNIFLASFGCTENCEFGDLNNSGVVDVSDLNTFLIQYGNICN